MLRALSLIAAFFLIYPVPLWSQDFRVVDVDPGRWPVLRLTAILPTPDINPESYSLKLGPDGRSLTAKEMAELDRSEPVSVLVALDTSFSLTPAHLKTIQGALARYAVHLGSGEQIALLGFNNTVNLSTAFTGSLDVFSADLNKLRLGGRKTELYGCVLHGIDLLSRHEGWRHLLVVSDGHDEGKDFTIDQVIQSAAENGVQVSVLGLAGLPDDKAGKHLAVIKNLAEETGGVYVPIAAAEELDSGLYDLLAGQRPSVPENPERLFQLVFDLGPSSALPAVLPAELNYSSANGLWIAEFSLSVPQTSPFAAGNHLPQGESYIASAAGD